MLRYILFVLLAFNLSALEITIQGAQENFQDYSTLHIKNNDQFLCQEIKNDYQIITEIVCAFSQRPSKQFQEIQNDFFKITSQIKNKTFFIIITPYEKIKLFPMIFDLSQDNTLFNANVKLADHWMLVGFKKELPFIKSEKKSETVINFPYYQDSDKFPFVGSLDIKGNPVYIKKVEDVTEYLKIKKYYEEQKYRDALSLIDEIVEKYPNSLFIPELLSYKMKVFAKLDMYNELIDVSKVYFREYSSNDNIPEILSLTAKSYAKMGINSDADYFFDRLFSEHKDSPYAKWGYIYKAQMLDESGASSKALYFYTKALQETQNLEIAATAAYSLINYYIKNIKTDKAMKYTMKIINAKPSFFMNDYERSVKIMNFFKEEQEYATAAAIANAMLKEIGKKHDDFEVLLKDKGLWLAKSEKKQEALVALNDYLKAFKNGDYVTEVKIAKDGLFFDTSDSNFSEKLSKYNELIENYSGDSIGNKALYEKAKLLGEHKKYKEVLSFENDLLDLDSDIYKDTKTIIREAAIGEMTNALKSKECQKVLDISRDYNVTILDSWDDGIYECSMKGADFLLAKKIAVNNLKSKDLEKRKQWLYRYIKVDFRTGNYSDAIDASTDLISLIEDDKKSKYLDVYRILFDSYSRLEDTDKMVASIADVEKIFGVTYKDIERYVAVMSIGSEKKDDNMIIKYATKIMEIQKSSQTYVQSPYVEFTLYQAYINKEDYNEALDIIKVLDKVDLSDSQRARQKYILGTIYEKLWREDEANKAYQESVDADATSPWAKLAKGAMDI